MKFKQIPIPYFTSAEPAWCGNSSLPNFLLEECKCAIIFDAPILSFRHLVTNFSLPVN